MIISCASFVRRAAWALLSFGSHAASHLAWRYGGFIVRVRLLRLFGVHLIVACFYWRVSTATKADPRGRDFVTRAADFARIVVRLAPGCRRVVEIGTGAGTTATGLALADRKRAVWSYDPHPDKERIARYARFAPRAAQRVAFICERGDSPSDPPSDVDLAFIDSSHDRDETVAEFKTWEPRVVEGRLVVFHDYNHEGWPGVVAAIEEDLKLDGQLYGHDLFVWRKARSGDPVEATPGAAAIVEIQGR